MSTFGFRFSAMRLYQLKPSRINWQKWHCSAWQFSSSSSLAKARPPRSPRVKDSEPRRPLPNPNVTQPPPLSRGAPRESSDDPQFDTSNVVVGSVIVVCILVYGYHTKLQEEFNGVGQKRGDPRPLEAMDRHMVLSAENIAEGRYYTIFTSSLTHYGLGHLGFNMLSLWAIGRPMVRHFGPRTFAILWIGGSLVGGIGSILHSQSTQLPKQNVHGKSLGASDSVLALFAAWSCVLPNARVQLFFIPMTMRTAAAVIVGTSLACEYNGWLPMFGHAAHLGGMAFGAFWWLVSIRRGNLGDLPWAGK